VQRFGKWRLAFLAFLIAYCVLLLLYLDYAPIQWDETPHLVGGLLLSRGQIHEYTQNYLFYPPLFDATTALYYLVLGASVFSVRLIALTFGILSIWVVFEYSYRVYGSRNALLSSILLASMPGFIVLCRLALIETMLMFFFSTSLFLFFLWTHTKNNKLLLLSGVAMGLGVIAKYQSFVSGIVMFVSLLFMWRKRIPKIVGEFLFIAIIAVAVVLPLFFFAYQQSVSETLGEWLYVIQVGNEERMSYSGRFPFPIFYLIEMIYPYSNIHPISIPVYIFALLGLGFWLWRRRSEDKFSLIWFFVVYSVFTLIPNKNWRYITLVFPILAISASDFILLLLDKAKENLRAPHISFRDRSVTKVAATALVVLVSVSVIFSSWQAYSWVKMDQIYVPVEEACQYVAEHSVLNETAVALFTSNLFSMEMMRFYLAIHDPGQRELWHYPEKPVDVFELQFNATLLIEQSEALNVKYLLLFEHGNNPFFKSDWRYSDVIKIMLNTGRFVKEPEFGSAPRRIFIIRFLSNS
jgi:4-amino-4-deoxy-L-arabinose transferase-like glycosyltransferase